MEFTITHNVNEKSTLVKFTNYKKVKISAWEHLYRIFKYMGANQCDSTSYLFPNNLNSDIISELIRNTCFECGGLMKDSIAFQNSLVSFNDFDNDFGSRGTTQSYSGPAKQVQVRKCSQCGHSHT